MVTKKEVLKEKDFLVTLKNIMETYEEIAATRMSRVRSSVLGSRDFLLEVNDIFQKVKSSYKNKIALIMQKKKVKDPSKLTFLKRNGKTVYVFVSANTGLYGEIIRKTYNLFFNTFKNEPGDVVVIGKLGLDIFRASKISANLSYFDMPDNKIDHEALKKTVDYIIKYEKVLIFYERFDNVVSQSPVVMNISGDPLPGETTGTPVKYFFEPSLEKIMEFFEKEIFATIFQQTILESELAKFASRMVSLDLASEDTQKRLNKLILQKERIRHQENNKKQLEKFASMRLWRK